MAIASYIYKHKPNSLAPHLGRQFASSGARGALWLLSHLQCRAGLFWPPPLLGHATLYLSVS